MEDYRIVNLYFERNKGAIRHAAEKCEKRIDGLEEVGIDRTVLEKFIKTLDVFNETLVFEHLQSCLGKMSE